ncbi:hypothetical protein LTR86_010200 [Recurvomyces mirabilis]|nr:hypothetical protein LTR86_010200 [Recurvomyces mirabilis]
MAAAADPTTTVEIVDYSTVHETSTIYVAPASTTSSESSTESLGHAQPYGEFPTHQMVSTSSLIPWQGGLRMSDLSAPLSGATALGKPPLMYIATSLHLGGPPDGPHPAGPPLLGPPSFTAPPPLFPPLFTGGEPSLTHASDLAPTLSFLTQPASTITHESSFASNPSVSTPTESTSSAMSAVNIVSQDATSITEHANVLTKTVTDTTTIGQSSTSTAPMSTLYSTSTMTTTIVVPLTMTPALSTSTSIPVTTEPSMAASSNTSQVPVGITAASAPLPSDPTALNATAVEQCLTEPGGVQKAGELPQPGCGSIFQHIEDCYGSNAPWMDPYNTTQSLNFQTCLCETSATNPFGKANILWQNFTGCANCLESFTSGILVDTLASEFSNIENFCCSQNPVAYLIIANFEAWLAALNAGISLTAPPLTGAITAITSLSSLFTTTPPLANLAYGVSAPLDGTLGGVTPELMTATIIMPASAGHPPSTEKITKLLDWMPTASPSGTITPQFDTAAASLSAASVANSELYAALSTLAAQGGPSQMCHGKCPNSGGARKRPSLALLATVSVLLTSHMMGALL